MEDNNLNLYNTYDDIDNMIAARGKLPSIFIKGNQQIKIGE